MSQRLSRRHSCSTSTGPGAKVKAITVSPDPVQLVGAATAPFTISATDSSGAATAVPPLIFTSSDATIAAVGTTALGSPRPVVRQTRAA